jgi:hypothetical protein
MAAPSQNSDPNSKRPRRLPSTPCSACGRDKASDYAAALCALRIVYTWATFREGEELEPKKVARLVGNVLKDFSEPNTYSGTDVP